MNIQSKRFHIKSGPGPMITVYDRYTAPQFPHVVDPADLPSAEACARMTEDQFDERMRALFWKKET